MTSGAWITLGGLAFGLVVTLVTAAIHFGKVTGSMKRWQEDQDRDLKAHNIRIQTNGDSVDEITKSFHAMDNKLTEVCQDVKWIRKSINGASKKE